MLVPLEKAQMKLDSPGISALSAAWVPSTWFLRKINLFEDANTYPTLNVLAGNNHQHGFIINSTGMYSSFLYMFMVDLDKK